MQPASAAGARAAACRSRSPSTGSRRASAAASSAWSKASWRAGTGSKRDLRRVGLRRREVVAARDQQPVEPLRERADVVLERQQDGRRARLRQRAAYDGLEIRVLARGMPAAPLVQTRRNADERPHRARVYPRARSAGAAERATMHRGPDRRLRLRGQRRSARCCRSDGDVVFGLRRRVVWLPAGRRADRGGPRRADEPGPAAGRARLRRLCGVAGRRRRRALPHRLRRRAAQSATKRWSRQGQRPRRMFFASSTSVYGQHDGEWVDETSPTEPVDFRGRRLLEAEQLLATGSLRGRRPVRFGGIYGPRRSGLIDAVRGGRAVLRAGPAALHQPHPPRRLRGRSAPPDAACPRRSRSTSASTASRPTRRRCCAGSPARSARRAAHRGRGRAARPRAPRQQALPQRSPARERLRFRYPTFREGYGAILAERLSRGRRPRAARVDSPGGAPLAPTSPLLARRGRDARRGLLADGGPARAISRAGVSRCTSATPGSSPSPARAWRTCARREHPGLHRYSETQGLPELIDAIVDKVRARNRIPCERRVGAGDGRRHRGARRRGRDVLGARRRGADPGALLAADPRHRAGLPRDAGRGPVLRPRRLAGVGRRRGARAARPARASRSTSRRPRTRPAACCPRAGSRRSPSSRGARGSG